MIGQIKESRRSTLRMLGALGCGGLALASQRSASAGVASNQAAEATQDSSLDLSTPEKRSEIIVKVMGSTAAEATHAYMRFHVYGFAGTNAVPFFSMNNYLIQYWEPVKYGTYNMRHYEVGYFTKFGTDEPITYLDNPITGETVEMEHFVLGPVRRSYTPTGIVAPGIAPEPLSIDVIGDRVFIPTQSIESFPSMFPPSEWPEISNQEKVYWDSFYTYSASVADILDGDSPRARAEIHMQNLTSWQPFLRLGRTPGRLMVRAFGAHVPGFEVLSADVRRGFEQHTPQIFDTESWTTTLFDNVEYFKKMTRQGDSKR
ncbi:MAG: DUF1838 family protein [Woeseiaceae bacterium]